MFPGEFEDGRTGCLHRLVVHMPAHRFLLERDARRTDGMPLLVRCGDLAEDRVEDARVDHGHREDVRREGEGIHANPEHQGNRLLSRAAVNSR